jgi:ferredoxin
MCEFCLKHGEGRKWYLEANNYSDDLLSDVRRRGMIEEFFSTPKALESEVESLEGLKRAPAFFRAVVTRIAQNKAKKTHYGQVVPLEDVEQIFEMVNSVIRVACICRHITVGEEKRYCYGISMSPDGGELGKMLRGLDNSFLRGPDSVGIESVSKQEAISAFRDHEHEGLCHTIWTFRAPFIGGVCNCDRSDCLAMRCTVSEGFPVMFRAEYVASVDRDACNGCRQCMRVCQFGAIGYSASNKKVAIDSSQCYGCGICRSVCSTDAIRLEDRASVPMVANIW